MLENAGNLVLYVDHWNVEFTLGGRGRLLRTPRLWLLGRLLLANRLLDPL